MGISASYIDEGYRTFIASGAIELYRLVKLAGDNVVAVCNAGDTPIGASIQAQADTLALSVALLNKQGTILVTADGAITQNALVYAGALGRVSATVAGLPIGVALLGASDAGDIIEVLLTERSSFQNPAGAFTLMDDFFHYVTGDEFSTVATDSGTAADTDAAGGVLSITPSDGTVTNNDEVYVKSTQELFLFANGKPLVFQARVKWTEGNTDDANVLVGLMSAIAANSLLDDGGGPAASYSGAVFFKVDGETTWRAEASIAGTQTTIALTNIPAAPGAGNFQTLEIYFIPTSSTVATLLFYIDNVLVGSTAAFTYTSATEMNAGVGLKNGADTTVETLLIDFIRVSQVR